MGFSVAIAMDSYTAIVYSPTENILYMVMHVGASVDVRNASNV